MKFLTDENVAISVFRTIKKLGFDVKSVMEIGLESKSDAQILEFALKDNRIIITHDKDFANLFYTNKKHKGIILLKFKKQNPNNISNVLIKIFQSEFKDKLENNIIIISEHKIIIHRVNSI